MEYQVTATRLRPQKFEDLLGQEFVAATLQKSIEAGKIAHAYLFSGPRGCGKTSSARILAKVINCVEAPNLAPCGKCTACEEITAGSCLDVIEIDGASNTGVNDVRQIKDEILFPPNSNRYKVYIIDEVHMLSTSAFNALLKTIEEPPPYVVFIFATTEIHKVPATIKSRCQQFNFKLVPVEILKEALNKACESLNIKAEDEALYWIAREATGSVRDAYTLFDQVAAFSDANITFEKIHEKLGLTGIESINKLVLACVQKNTAEALTVIDEILQNGISIEQIVLDSADYFRSLLLIKNGITKEALIGQSAERFPAEILNAWNSVQIEQALSIMLQLFKDLRFSIDPRFELELAVSRLSWLVDFVSPVELKRLFDSAKNLLASNSSNGIAPAGSHAGHSNSNMPTNGYNQGQEAFKATFSQTQNQTQNHDDSGEINRSFSDAGSLTDQFKEMLKNNYKLSEKSGNEETVQTIRKNENADFNSSNFNEVSLESNEERSSDAEKNSENDSTTYNYKLDDIQAFKEDLVKYLSKKNALISSALAQTKNWEIKDNSLFIFVKSSFDLSLLQKQLNILQKAVFEISSKQFKIVIEEILPETESNLAENEEKEPDFIEFLLDLFNGKIVAKTLQEVEITEDIEIE